MIVPFVAGGGADVTARHLGEQLGARWKQAVVIQNSGGAGGNLAVAATASSEPTGYTVLFSSIAIVANNPTLYGKLPSDPDRDLAPVILLGEIPFQNAAPNGIYVRSGTPAAVVSALNRDVQAVLDDPAYRKQMSALGFELAGGTPQQLTAYVQAERKKWVPIIRKLGIKGN